MSDRNLSCFLLIKQLSILKIFSQHNNIAEKDTAKINKTKTSNINNKK